MLMHMESSLAVATAVERTLEQFKSGGRSIRMETFGGSKTAPSILVLHGATGVEFANRFIAELAQAFAAQGFVVHLVHYFDRTGSVYADDATIKASSDQWLETVHDAVSHVRQKRPQARVGMFGFSLGGYLAAAEAVHNEAVACAVILSGGLDEASVRRVRHAPPMLILHGDADSRVPIQEARRLEVALKKAGRAPEFHVYPGEGHIMNMMQYADVVKRGAAFFLAKLTGPPP